MTVSSSRAPDVRRMWPASSPRYRVLKGTRTAPAAYTPNDAAIHRALFGAQRATRSPGSTPVAASARATSTASLPQLREGDALVAIDHCLAVREVPGSRVQGGRDRVGDGHQARRSPTLA